MAAAARRPPRVVASQLPLQLLLLFCGVRLSYAESPAAAGSDAGLAQVYFCGVYAALECYAEERSNVLVRKYEALKLAATGGALCEEVLRRVLCTECDTGAELPPAESEPGVSPPSHCGPEACDNTYRVLAASGGAPGGSGLLFKDLYPTPEFFQVAFCGKPLTEEEAHLSGSAAIPNGKDAIAWNSSMLSGEGASTRRSLAAQPDLCFERISDATPLKLHSHPGNKRLAVTATQDGLLSLVRMPPPGTAGRVVTLGTWLDLRARTLVQGERGFLSFEFHPKFASNGRFFVSYICDSNKHHDCVGNCECTAANGCDPKANPASTCNGHTIVAEYRAAGRPAVATHVTPTEVRRFFKIGRPYSNHNGGDIFFGRDGYFYYTSGDGGFGGDPWNFAQKRTSFLGKVLRIDVDHAPAGRSYGIPPGNPFVHTPGARPEIYALGLRNPWRASVDRVNGAIWVGDVGQDTVEEVDRLLPGHNYGWHNYEGALKTPPGGLTPGGFTPVSKMLGHLTFPVLQYTHASVGSTPAHPKSVAVTGGYVYRATAGRNKCLQGKYVYSDLYGPIFVANVYTAKPAATHVGRHCAADSPLPCTPANFGAMWSWAQDSDGELYILSSNGIFHLTDLHKCGISC